MEFVAGPLWRGLRLSLLFVLTSQLGHYSFLRRATLRTTAARSRYQKAVDAFVDSEGVDIDLERDDMNTLDEPLENNFEGLYHEKAHSHARDTLAGFRRHFAAKRGDTASFPLASDALSGWRQLEPDRTVPGLPHPALSLMAQWLSRTGTAHDLQAARAAIVEYDLIPRPGELLQVD